MRKKKVMVSLLLDKEVVDWLDGEAANDDTTLDEFVNNRLMCLKSVNSLDEKDYDKFRMLVGMTV